MKSDGCGSFGTRVGKWRFCAGLMAPFLFPSLAGAVNSTVYLSVTVVDKPTCVINGDRALLVDFGDELFTNRVDGEHYLKTLDFTLECKSNRKNAMKMKLAGNATAFDGSALQTNQADLGIALRANGRPLPINSWLNFTYPDRPLLQAVPVKRSGGVLQGGVFSVGATLLVDYQ
ncbi:fimbrial protein [Serratia marcescens]|uniref:fimbrial protein n=1 Tax=Serratia marcescens TaxID=615 RepID=UPI003990B3D4